MRSKIASSFSRISVSDRLRTFSTESASCGLMHRSKAPTLFDHLVQAAEGMDQTIAGDGTCIIGSNAVTVPAPVRILASGVSQQREYAMTRHVALIRFA